MILRPVFCLLALLFAAPAFAFHCGSRIIDDGISLEAVIEHCGEPSERRYLGFRVVPYVGERDGRRPGVSRIPPGSRFSVEVRVIELIYDFGPRKLMRRLTFYDEVLVNVETLGYGERQQ